MELSKKKGVGVQFSVIMPALDEQENIKKAIDNALSAFKDLDLEGEIIVINDGSQDATRTIIEELMTKHSEIRLINHDYPMGIGRSFWEGVDQSQGDAIVMLPGDNENDPWEIFRYGRLLEHVDMVIPFLFNREARSIFRNILSVVYRLVINMSFQVNFNYTNGTVLYRKSLLKELKYRSNSFFFQTDILIRNVKKGYLFAEVPYRINQRANGVSKAVSVPSFLQVARGYLLLLRDYSFGGRIRFDRRGFATDSRSAERYETAHNPIFHE